MIRSGSPVPDSSYCVVRYAPMLENGRWSVVRSTKSGGDTPIFPGPPNPS